MLTWDACDRCIVVLSFLEAVSLLSFWCNDCTRAFSWAAVVLMAGRVASSPSLRLQMFWRTLPLYVINLIVAAVVAVYSVGSLPHLFSRIMGCVTLVLAALTAIILFLLPVPSPDRLRGRFQSIGTYSFHLPLTEAPEGEVDTFNAFVAVQCWFPLQRQDSLWSRLWESLFCQRSVLWTSGHPADQADESAAILHAIARDIKAPSFFAEHLSLARTHAIYTGPEAAVSNIRFPVAIYSHGMYGWRQIHHSACESLASEGFFVFACDHAPDCMVSRPLVDSGHPFTSFSFKVPEDKEERAYYMTGMRRRLRDVQNLLRFLQGVADTATTTNTADSSSTVGASGELAQVFSSIRGRLDMTKVCLWGHSFGGGTVTAYACKPTAGPPPAAVVALDSWMYPVPDVLRERGIQGPVAMLKLSAEQWVWGKYQVPFRQDVMKRSQELRVGLDLVIRQSDHQNFCEVYYLAHPWLLRRPNILGSVDPWQHDRVIHGILASFFAAAIHGPTPTADGTQSLLSFCEKGSGAPASALSKETQAFIESRIVPASEVEGFGDSTVFDRVNSSKKESKEREAESASQ